MEDFKNWVADIGQQKAAELMGCSQSLISHLITGRKRFTEDLAIKAEQASQGRAPCESTRPDLRWYRRSGVIVGYRVPVQSRAA